jgi:hypothetical protein
MGGRTSSPSCCADSCCSQLPQDAMITWALQPYLPGDELYHMIIDLSDGSVELSYAKVKHSDELS